MCGIERHVWLISEGPICIACQWGGTERTCHAQECGVSELHWHVSIIGAGVVEVTLFARDQRLHCLPGIREGGGTNSRAGHCFSAV